MLLEVANGPAKNMCLAEFWSDFMSLSVSNCKAEKVLSSLNICHTNSRICHLLTPYLENARDPIESNIYSKSSLFIYDIENQQYFK